jgi:hypothetical protein
MLGRVLTCCVGGMLTVQQATAENKSIHMPEVAAFALAPMDLCTLPDDGFLSGDLFGALSENIQWLGDDMECGGMLRPDDNGIRLVFAAPRQDERLLIVLGIAGKLDDLVGSEHTANITIVDEVNDRFFSTGRQERCWATIEFAQPVTEQVMTIAGEVYCAGSLPSLSDNSSIAIRNIHFSGRLLLDESTQN